MKQLISVLLVCLATAASQQILPMTPEQYVTLAKCSFVIHGEFTYNQAVQACASRKAMLGFFVSPSEEHATRLNIDFRVVPGYMRENGKWLGQLWLGVKRSPSRTCYIFDQNPIFPNMQVPFTVFGRDESMRIDPNAQCVVMRETGWAPIDCNGMVNGVKQGAGALCTSFTRSPPNDSITAQSRNYCGTYLLPPAVNSVALPMVIKKQYFFARGNFSQSDAERFCASRRAQLATLRSQEEFEFVKKNLDFSCVDNKAWFGLKRPIKGKDDPFVWVDGMPNSFNDPFLKSDVNASTTTEAPTTPTPFTTPFSYTTFWTAASQTPSTTAFDTTTTESTTMSTTVQTTTEGATTTGNNFDTNIGYTTLRTSPGSNFDTNYGATTTAEFGASSTMRSTTFAMGENSTMEATTMDLTTGSNFDTTTVKTLLSVDIQTGFGSTSLNVTTNGTSMSLVADSNVTLVTIDTNSTDGINVTLNDATDTTTIAPTTVVELIKSLRVRSAPEEECVAFVKLDDGTFGWQTKDCNEEISAICEIFQIL